MLDNVFYIQAYGHKHVSVLDGGYKAWKASHFDMSEGEVKQPNKVT